MDKVVKNRWQVRIAAMIIFVLGFAAGILALNVYRGVSGFGRPHDRFEQMAQRLNLSEEQKTKVQQILGETRDQLRAVRRESEPKMDEVRRQADARLQEVLRPEQWQQFQTMRREGRERERRRGGPRFEAK